jgi:hypothetical protein
MIRRLAFLLVLPLLVSACGRQVSLRPKRGSSLPLKPEGAVKTPTADDLIKPTTQAKPQRSDEQLKRSEQRREDEFDLPPSSF